MTRWYLDTSAAVKLMVPELESDSLAAVLDEAGPDLVAGQLLETELRRVVWRTGGMLAQETVTALLSRVTLYELPPSVFRSAGLLPGEHLRSLDALHLAAAVRLDVDAVLTYDSRMSDAARSVGLAVMAPAPGRRSDSA